MKKPSLRFKIIDKNKKVVRKVTTRKINRVYAILSLNRYKDCTFKIVVRYGKDPEGGYFKNEGTYKTKKELKHAIKCFTSPNLIKDFQ